MKTYKLFLLFLSAVLILSASSYAQTQNPNYKQSEDKYVKYRDSMNGLQGTTIQQTYKAYDWREAKAEREYLRRLWRHQERMERARAGYYYYDYPYYYSYPYYYPSYRYRWGIPFWRSGWHIGFGGYF